MRGPRAARPDRISSRKTMHMHDRCAPQSFDIAPSKIGTESRRTLLLHFRMGAHIPLARRCNLRLRTWSPPFTQCKRSRSAYNFSMPGFVPLARISFFFCRFANGVRLDKVAIVVRTLRVRCLTQDHAPSYLQV